MSLGMASREWMVGDRVAPMLASTTEPIDYQADDDTPTCLRCGSGHPTEQHPGHRPEPQEDQ